MITINMVDTNTEILTHNWEPCQAHAASLTDLYYKQNHTRRRAKQKNQSNQQIEVTLDLCYFLKGLS